VRRGGRARPDAAVEVAGTTVGDHLAVEAEPEAGDGHVVTHSFATTDPAYVGWRWAVTVVRAEGSDDVTVDEVVLLPGEAALLAPAGCRGATGCSPVTSAPATCCPRPRTTRASCRPTPTSTPSRCPSSLSRELGLGRPRVLSLDGRADAAERWYEGEAGPDTPVAKAAPVAAPTAASSSPSPARSAGSSGPAPTRWRPTTAASSR
jgi:hypothetical protein